MARDSLTGSRIRERRVMSGMRQADLARYVGISASYLNLIEHNRRRIGGKLLLDIANVLEVEPSLLTEGAEAALIASLREAAAERTATGAELDRTDEFAGRFPGWARLLAESRRRIDTLEQTVETLSDRLAHDPHLAASLHEVLSTVTAIRSTASILADTRELEPEWRDRFHRNINEDSQRLAESSQSLVRYLDTAADAGTKLASPQEEVDAFLAAHKYHFPDLEKPDADPEALLDATTLLTSAAARDAVRRLLVQYAADALTMPIARVAQVIEGSGADPAALALACNTGLNDAMRRLAGLPEGMTRGPVGLVVCDAAGALTYRKPLDEFQLPRFGAACPLWPLFAGARARHGTDPADCRTGRSR